MPNKQANLHLIHGLLYNNISVSPDMSQVLDDLDINDSYGDEYVIVTVMNHRLQHRTDGTVKVLVHLMDVNAHMSASLPDRLHLTLGVIKLNQNDAMKYMEHFTQAFFFDVVAIKDGVIVDFVH